MEASIPRVHRFIIHIHRFIGDMHRYMPTVEASISNIHPFAPS
jgi:hypothetical protein